MADTAGPDTTSAQALPTQTQQGRATPDQVAAGAPPAAAPAPAQGVTPPAQEPSQGVTPAASASTQGVTPPSTVNTTPQSQTRNPDVGQTPSAQPSSGVTTTAQSETPPTPSTTGQSTMQIDPRPLVWLQKNDPDKAAMVESAAQEAGINPARLAAHMYFENRFRMGDAPTSSAGAVGPMQILPSTAPEVNNGGKLDINNPVDNVRMGANYIRQMDDKFGRDTPASIAAYHAGPGGAMDIAQHPEAAMDRHPKTMDYLSNITGNKDVSGLASTIAQARPNSSTPQGLAQAASSGGPDGLLKYLVATRGSQQPLSEAWQAAESSLQRAALWSGNIEGMGQASDAILRMAHQGSNQYLQAASQALSSGDSTSAAGYLAKAHAFFPDNSYGKFGTDAQGNLFAQRFDETSGQPVGKPVSITQQGILAMLNQTSDPNKFAQSLMAEQKNMADVRFQNAHSDYYTGRNAALEAVAAGHDQARVTAAALAHPAGAPAKQTPEEKAQQATQVAANKEVAPLYGADVDPGTPQVRAREAQVHVAARLAGADPVTAESLARGVARGDYMPVTDAKGNEGLADKKGNIKTTLPPGSIKRIFGDLPQAQGVPTKGLGSAPSPLNGAPTLAGAGTPQGTQGIPAAGPPTSPQPTQ